MRSLHHEIRATQARALDVTRALPLALLPFALVVLSLCRQAWLCVVLSARFGPIRRVPPKPPLASAAFVRRSMHLGWTQTVVSACDVYVDVKLGTSVQAETPLGP